MIDIEHVLKENFSAYKRIWKLIKSQQREIIRLQIENEELKKSSKESKLNFCPAMRTGLIPDKVPVLLSEFIRKRRKALDMTQDEVSSIARMSRANVAMLETQATNMTISSAFNLLQALSSDFKNFQDFINEKERPQ